jgi:hypothetical protein
MILIGSRALALRAPHILGRKPLDFDFICTMDEYNIWLEKNSAKVNPTKIYPLAEGKKMIVEGDTNCEFEILQPGASNEMLLKLVEEDADTIQTSFGMIPNLDLLFTLKSSHKHLKDSPHFWKTLKDYHRMKLIGASIRPEYMDFFKLREKETYAKQKHPSLMQSKDNFFKDDGIMYVYDHDDIHESVKHLEQPAYRYYMKDGSEVFSDKNKFFACSRETQLYGVVEEAATLAIERSLVPHPGVMKPQEAWGFALSKVLTSITSGWFREFGYENAFDVMKLYPTNYWDKFQADVAAGKVRLFKKAS